MLLLYGIIFVLTTALLLSLVFSLRSRKESNAIIEEQERTISNLKMQSIRNRMSPHFFFNALSALANDKSDPETSRQTIKTLRMLLRKSIENIEQTAITLDEELEVVQGYIDLQTHRIAPPFDVTYEFEPGINMNQLIPAMIIQIPVENAIKHGLIPLEGEKRLKILIHKYADGIKIIIEDNGKGYQSSSSRTIGTGTGLKILYQTISLLNRKNRSKIEFTISDKTTNQEKVEGTLVEISIPDHYSFVLK